ncbi:MAG: uroporphyrinogen-III decarboxylase-like protein [Armatimonadetes bacterium]|nr:uroporphyrinogen-III decarboxylase-like protein [Armatimonadota bacterium]
MKTLAIKREPDFQRFLTALGRGEPDRVPFIELSHDAEIYEQILEEPLVPPDTPQERVWHEYWRNRIRCLAALGYDHVNVYIGIPFPRKMVTGEDTALYSRGQRTWQDEQHGAIETWEDFEKSKWPRPEDIDYSQLEIAAQYLPDGMIITASTPGGILENAMWVMGYAPFSYALFDQPDLVKAVFERVGELELIAVENAVQHDKVGALFVGDDMGHKHGLLVSADVIREYVLPWHKRMVEVAHKAGKPYILHACGNVEEIMDDYIDYCGIDAKHSYEDVIMPVTEAKKKYGHRIAICGGVDVDKMARLPEPELRNYVRQILEECAPGGGYLLGSGNSVTNYVPVENFLAMLDEGLKFSGG